MIEKLNEIVNPYSETEARRPMDDMENDNP